MSLLCLTRDSQLVKPPPPKKKWIQDYKQQKMLQIEDGGAPVVNNGLSGNNSTYHCTSNLTHNGVTSPTAQQQNSAVVQNVIDQFQDYIDETNKRKHASNTIHTVNGVHTVQAVQAVFGAAAQCRQMCSLLDPAKQGEKFNNSLRQLSSHVSTHVVGLSKQVAGPTAIDCPSESNNSSLIVTGGAQCLDLSNKNKVQVVVEQENIGELVQDVIGQFLNGSLADSDFLRSRKRSSASSTSAKQLQKRKHSKRAFNHHKKASRREARRLGKSGSKLDLLPKQARLQQLNSSLQCHSQNQHVHSTPELLEEGVVLNLSLPKSPTTSPVTEKVSLEKETASCYSLDKGSCYSSGSVTKPTTSPYSLHASKLSPLCRKEHVGVIQTTVGLLPPELTTQSAFHNGVVAPPSNASQTVATYIGSVSRPAILRLGANPLATMAQVGGGLPPARPVRPVCPVQMLPVSASAMTTLPSKALPKSCSQSTFSKPGKSLLSSDPNDTVGRHSTTNQSIQLASAAALTTAARDRSTNIVSSKKFPPTITPIKLREKQQPAVAGGQVKQCGQHRKGSGSGGRWYGGSAAASTTATASKSSRVLHNQLEKNRRAHLRLCFDDLATECELDPRKVSNLMVIRSAYKCVMRLKRAERENEKVVAELVKEKIRRKQLLEELKQKLPAVCSESETLSEHF